MDRAHERAMGAGELRAHVEESGFREIAERLALTDTDLRAALRGVVGLDEDRVLALRDGVAMGPILAAERRAKERAPKRAA